MKNTTISDGQVAPTDNYIRLSVATDVLVFTINSEAEDNYRKLPEKKLSVLLIKRSDEPFKGSWSLPGGFLGETETCEACARRKLLEKTGVKDLYLEQLFTFSEMDRDPRGRVLSCAYLALLESGKLALQEVEQGMEAAWFDVTYRCIKEESHFLEGRIQQSKVYQIDLIGPEKSLQVTTQKVTFHMDYGQDHSYHILSSEGLAFDHGKIIAMGLDRLKNKLEYSALAFHLLPKLFTLTELQRVYETILGEELLTANFRRKVAHLVVETNDYAKNSGHRPSKLFRRNWEVLI